MKMFEETLVFDVHWLKPMFSKIHCLMKIWKDLILINVVFLYDVMVSHCLKMMMVINFDSRIQILIQVEEILIPKQWMSWDLCTNSMPKNRQVKQKKNPKSQIYIHYIQFHIQNITFIISFVSNIGEFRYTWWINFLKQQIFSKTKQSIFRYFDFRCNE